MAEYCEVALPVPLDQSFVYSVPAGIELQPGVRVLAPFGVRKVVGVVLRCASKPAGIDTVKIKPVQRVLDEEPVVSEELLRLSRWTAEYYLVPQGEVLATMLPLQATLHSKVRVVLTDAGRDHLAAALASSLIDKATSAETHLLQRVAKRGGLRRETLRGDAPLL